MQKLTQEETGRVLSVLRDAGEGVSLLARVPLTRRHAEALAAKMVASAGAGAGDASRQMGTEVQRLAELEQAHRDMLKEAAAAQRAAAASAAAAALAAASLGVGIGAGAPAAGSMATFGGSMLAGGLSALSDETAGPREDPQLRLQYGQVLRLARSDPAAAAALAASAPAPPAESGLSALAATLKALEGVAARSLGSTRQQQEDLAVEMTNKMGRIDNAEREVALLRQELAKQRALRARASGELDALLIKLKDELVQSQKLAANELQGMQSAGGAKTALIAEQHSKSEVSLQAQLEKLQADLKAAGDAHIDAEANLRKRRARARLEVETLVREYDVVQAAAEAELAAVRASIAKEARPLADLKVYYSKVDAELLRLDGERLKAEERFFWEVTVETLRRRIAGMALLRFYKPLKVLKIEQEKWEAKERAKKGK